MANSIVITVAIWLIGQGRKGLVFGWRIVPGKVHGLVQWTCVRDMDKYTQVSETGVRPKSRWTRTASDVLSLTTHT
jgi:hypothetical protein